MRDDYPRALPPQTVRSDGGRWPTGRPRRGAPAAADRCQRPAAAAPAPSRSPLNRHDDRYAPGGGVPPDPGGGGAAAGAGALGRGGPHAGRGEAAGWRRPGPAPRAARRGHGDRHGAAGRRRVAERVRRRASPAGRTRLTTEARWECWRWGPPAQSRHCRPPERRSQPPRRGVRRGRRSGFRDELSSTVLTLGLGGDRVGDRPPAQLRPGRRRADLSDPPRSAHVACRRCRPVRAGVRNPGGRGARGRPPGCGPIVCTNGQPRAATMVLLRRLAAQASGCATTATSTGPG